ncbi:transposase [Streptomyces sp. NPDC060064]|uniref:transposase n=1 Tax=Streptomyces sp. NPDC060064 TaxID=3347049 RepID=UPI00369C5EFA
MRRELAEFVTGVSPRRIPERRGPLIGPGAWVVDVSFPKDGRMPVGVAPTYCGALGKQANRQVAVSVHAAPDVSATTASRRSAPGTAAGPSGA